MNSKKNHRGKYFHLIGGRGHLVLLVLVCCLSVLFFSGCARWIHRPVKRPEEALKIINIGDIPLERDDNSVSSFLEALGQSIQYYQKIPPGRIFRFGPYETNALELKNAFLKLRAFCSKHPEWKAICPYVRRNFVALQARGLRRDGKILFTGYYEPQVRGSLKKTAEFSYPLYKLPPNLVYVDLRAFGNNYPKKQLVGRLSLRKVEPFYTRREIDFEGKLKNYNCVLVWLHGVIDSFFIHIQGSAEIILPDGSKLDVGYAGSNGYPYRSIGSLLINEGEIPRERMSKEAIYEYLHRHPNELEKVLSYNQSYVFFRKVEKGPIGSLGVVLTPLRSIATDPYFFPRGSMAFIDTSRTLKGTGNNVGDKKPLDRFVFNQDRGGAIRGPGRVDYFWGKGEKAGEIAGSFKPWGKLFFFFPRRNICRN